LREVLEAFPTIPILLEVKAAEAQAAVATEIDRAGARERVVIASFQHRALDLLREGPYLIGADRRDVTALYTLGRLHLEAASPRCRCYAVPWRWKGKLEVPRRWFINAAHRQKRPVHVWTVDQPEIAKLLWRRGASGIITNKPALIREASS
jgi:glycerophosphoryl diester phosphodiesterase